MKKTMTKKKVKPVVTDDGLWDDRHDMIHKILRSVGNRKKFRRDLEDSIDSCRGSNAQKEEAREIINGYDIGGQKKWNRGFVAIHALLEKMTGIKFGGQP
jgi:hypothetical protein